MLSLAKEKTAWRKMVNIWLVVSNILGIFTPTWGRFPFWLIFFKGVETTNQKMVSIFLYKFDLVYLPQIRSCNRILVESNGPRFWYDRHYSTYVTFKPPETTKGISIFWVVFWCFLWEFLTNLIMQLALQLLGAVCSTFGSLVGEPQRNDFCWKSESFGVCVLSKDHLLT